MESRRKESSAMYRTIKIDSLGNRRRGKHHDLTGEILRQLSMAQNDTALVIPLADIVGIELPNLRSAVHRAAAAQNVVVETQSDEKNFYVWASSKNNSQTD